MKLTKSQAEQLHALERMKDEDIDFSNIPRLTGNEKLIQGKFYRPSQKSTIRVTKSTPKKSK